MKKMTAGMMVFALLEITLASAKPVEIDTANTHLIIVRPIDSFGNGHINIDNRTLNKFSDKTYAFWLRNKEGKSEKFISATNDNDPIAVAIKMEAEKIGFTPNSGTLGNGGTAVEISIADSMNNSVATELTKSQNQLWKAQVKIMGDPRKLEDKANKAQRDTNINALLGIVGGVALGAIGGKIIGSPIGAESGAVIGSQIGISPELIQVHSKVLGFNLLPEFDFSSYSSVDFRKADINHQRSGSLIIAYKTEKTPEIEQEALIAGIPVLLGFDETPEQVKQARQEDFEARMAVWNECIEAGKCKAE